MARRLIRIISCNHGSLQSALRVMFLFTVLGSARAQIGFSDEPFETRSSFFLTEFSFRYNAKSNRFTIPLTLGWMKTVTPRSALGCTIGLDPDPKHPDWYFSFGPRYRRLVTQNTNLNCTASLAVGNGGARYVNLQMIWMNRDVVGLDAGVLLDATGKKSGRDKLEPFVGARFGSKIGREFYKLIAVVIVISLIWNPFP